MKTLTSHDEELQTSPAGRDQPSTRERPARVTRRRLTPTLLTAVLALASGATALAFELWPSLRPDPRATSRAEMSVVATDRGVTFNQWLRRTSRSEAEYADRREGYVRDAGVRSRSEAAGFLRMPGYVLYVSTQLEGFKRRGAEVRWSVYETRHGQRLPGLSGKRALGLQLEAPTDRTMQEVWVPDPMDDGPYFVRLQLYDPDGALLAIADSKVIPGQRP